MPAGILSFPGFGTSSKSRYIFEEKHVRLFCPTFSHGMLIELWQMFKDILKMFKKELKPVGAERKKTKPSFLPLPLPLNICYKLRLQKPQRRTVIINVTLVFQFSSLHSEVQNRKIPSSEHY